MTVRVAINGFGRIGRNVLRAIAESGRTDIQVVGINDLGPVETNAHLLRFDSVHGRFPGEVKVERRQHRHRHRQDQGDGGQGPGAASLEGAWRRRRARVHRHLHLEGKGFGASDRRRQGVFWCQRRRTEPILPWCIGVNHDKLTKDHLGGLKRLVHHELPRAGCQGVATIPWVSRPAS